MIPMNSTFYTRFGKRWFDAAVSLIGLVFLSPLFLVVAVAVRLSSAGSAFFSQVRVGQFEIPFRILKFRTMRRSPSGSGSLLTAAGDPRITGLGRWLRKTKVDELPQILNVLAGDMSLVGPRPEVAIYISNYTAVQKEVFTARPGITGPSIILNEEQLMAGQADKERFYLTTILPAKLQVDLDYCSNITFSGDLYILFLTFGQLFRTRAHRSNVPNSIVHLATAPLNARRQPR
ncbi:MAG TPA: sugar transferase [Candidatus Dormibacteraeota bacterium]|jgi:lipopolysaccharide/colanic/teichoic acid biosynthesis glycosyltransferase|nr:sugar transferase [Candidatus Dormibacteraeota bacterium]